MRFKSADWAGQDIIWNKCCSSLLVCFSSLSCMSTNPWVTYHISNVVTWYCSIQSQSDSFCPSPSTNLRLFNWQMSQHTVTDLPPCFTVGVIQRVTALSPTLCSTKTLLFDRKILNFDSSVPRTLLHSSIVQFLSAFSLCFVSSTAVS